MSNQLKKRNKKHRTFGYTSPLKATIYNKADKKKHRNKAPVFMQNYQRKDYAYTVWFFLQRLHTHDINKNSYLNALRLAKYQRESIRRERREVLEVLFATLLTYCDFSPSSTYLFEVRANIEHLAKMCNQTYLSWDSKNAKKRVRYDTILHAIDMLEEAELITVLREYDHQGRKNKAMRIWLNVEFFLMFGITEQQLRKLLVDFHKYQFVNNRLDETFKEYEKHLAKLEHKGVADLKHNHSLRNLLIKRRKDLLGEHIIKFVSQRKPTNYLSFDIESDVFKPCFRSFSDCNTPEEVHKLQKRLLDKERLREKARLKAANDREYHKTLMQRYISQLQ